MLDEANMKKQALLANFGGEDYEEYKYMGRNMVYIFIILVSMLG